MKTNLQMYSEVYEHFKTNDNPNSECQKFQKKIVEIFNLKARTELDLANLADFLVSYTMFCGTDILKAEYVAGFKETVEAVRLAHEARCKLLSAILDAILDEKVRIALGSVRKNGQA